MPHRLAATDTHRRRRVIPLEDDYAADTLRRACGALGYFRLYWELIDLSDWLNFSRRHEGARSFFAL
jgi:hypothetical protein